MTVDSTTGDLVLATGRLGPAVAEDEFLNSTIGKSATRVRQTKIANWYEVWVPNVLEREAGIVLAFPPGGGLGRIRLKLVKPEVRSAGASGWSRAVEDEMKAFHDSWIREQLGEPPYQFPWGWATSVIDQHGYSAVVIVDDGSRPQPRN